MPLFETGSGTGPEAESPFPPRLPPATIARHEHRVPSPGRGLRGFCHLADGANRQQTRAVGKVDGRGAGRAASDLSAEHGTGIVAFPSRLAEIVVAGNRRS